MTACNRTELALLPTFIHPESIPPPKFQLFDIAILHFQSEAGNVTKDKVQIKGLTWSPFHFRFSGWVYCIRYLHQPTGSEKLKPGHEELCEEAELSTL
ncbi:MAG: hypothetical protein DCF15_10415 [Phormidesmis priestleyi]|uniref:Uncharacterized protein n=1 Tax=Phormidesmis priestleyi TaxID=268141 RepID=A0A2W4XEM9_9CYAN|nr:MAG: hypothetical protein DCF15_10415 [Phormidesmis priestleyi]